MYNIYTIILSVVVLTCIDMVYLQLIKSLFMKQIQMIQRSKIQLNIYSTILCYVFLVFAINYFIIQPKKSAWDAFLLGICIYGVYETTNLSLFSQWSVNIAIIDTLWGGTLFALTTYITYKTIKAIKV